MKKKGNKKTKGNKGLKKGFKMRLRGLRTPTKWTMFGLVMGVVIATVGSIGALNGWFGGGGAIPSDTMTRGLVGYWNFEEGSGTIAYDATDNNNDGTITAAPNTETLRPNAVGSNTNLTPTPTVDNYLNVDEAVADDATTYVFKSNTNPTAWYLDTYGLPNTAIGTGVITSVKVWARCRRTSDNGGTSQGKIAVRTNATVYYGTAYDLTTSWTNYSKEWTTNPNTSLAWTWAQVDALEAGFSGYLETGVNTDPYSTQVYVEVDYTPSGPPGWTTGKVGSALDFDGDDYVSVGNVYNGVKTVEFWIKTSSSTQQVLDLNGSAYVELSSNVIAATGWTSPTIYVDGVETTTITANTWHHVVITTDTGINATSTDLGRWSTNYFDGILDEVRFYSRALSGAEARYHYNRGGPVGHWKMDEGEGRTVYDSAEASTTANLDGTLILVGSATSSAWVQGKYGSAISFDGTDDYVDISDVSGRTRTISFWLKRTDTNDRDVIDLGTPEIKISSNAITSSGFTSPTYYVDGIQGATTVSANTWHHIVITDTADITADNVDIGKASSNYFYGLIDDVRIYNYARTPEEVRLDYNAGLAAHFGPQSDCDRDPGSCMTQGLVGYWDMEEGLGSTAYDASGNGNHGTLQPGSTYTCGAGHTDNGDGTCTGTWQIGVATDDSYRRLTPSGWGLDQGNQIAGAASVDAYQYGGGMRFLNITIPQAEIINSAYLTLRANVTGGGTTVNTRISAEDVDDAAAFADDANAFDTRWAARTTAIVDWDNIAAWTADVDYNSPEIKTVIQEIVDRASWASGNDIVIFWEDFDDRSSHVSLGYRAAYSYDVSTTNAAKLVVTYTPSSSSSLPSWTTGKPGGGLSFDGTNDYVDAGNVYNGVQSVEFWLKTSSSTQQILDLNGSAYVELSSNAITATGWTSPTIYVDGVETSTITADTWQHVVITTETGINASAVNLGKVSSYFDGILDEVRIYNRALSDAEVRYHYNRGGPVAQWKFDEGEGGGSGTVYDSTENNNDGTLILGNSGNTATSSAWVAGKYGSALFFDGVDDYVDIGDTSQTSVKTISFWLKADDITSRKIIDIDGTDQVEIDGSSQITATSFPGTVTYYLNGIAGSRTLTANTWYHVAITDTSGVNASNMDIGRVSTGYFYGLIDDVRIYNYVRTQEQIRQDYNAGLAAHFGESGSECKDDPGKCMTEGLVGYWNFEEGSGATAYDQSNYSNNGTIVSAPPWSQGIVPLSGGKKGGGALDLDGSADRLDVVSTNWDFNGNDFTLEAWYNTDTVISDVGNDARRLLAAGYNGENWGLGYGAHTAWNGLGNDCYNFFYNDGTYHDYMSDTISGGIGANTWHHAVMARERDILYFYHDGQPVGSTAFTYNSLNANDDELNIGVRQNEPDDTYTEYHPGLLDEMRIYNRALSAEEVRYHYNKGGPVAHWKMDEGEGRTVYDSTENDNDGTLVLVGSATSSAWVSGKYGSALSFDGTDDYVDVGDTSQTSVKTISFWLKADDIISRKIIDIDGTDQVEIDSSSQIAATSFPGTITYYLNGIAGFRTLTANTWYHVAITDTTSVNASNMDIGRVSTGYFDGLIDDVKIFNYARTPQQILLDYNQGLSAHFK